MSGPRFGYANSLETSELRDGELWDNIKSVVVLVVVDRQADRTVEGELTFCVVGYPFGVF